MKKCTNNRTMSFRRLLSLLLGLVLFMELLPGGLTVVGDASDAVTVTVVDDVGRSPPSSGPSPKPSTRRSNRGGFTSVTRHHPG